MKNGKPIFQAGELFNARQLNGRQARGGIGQLANGNIVLVSVEGTKPAYSIGMSSYELAVELSRLGAVTAYGLGAGSAAGLAFDGDLLTRPSTGTTPKVSDALVLSYTGIYAAQPSAPVLSPNGDGVGDTETLSYRVVRPSQVVATLSGPQRHDRSRLRTGRSPPGVHTADLERDPRRLSRTRGQVDVHRHRDRRPQHLDDARRGRSRSTTRFRRSPSTPAPGSATATFQLTRPATVVVQVERPTGVPVATLRSGKLVAGAERLTWRGRIGGGLSASSGRYQVAVQATSPVGTSSLVAPFSFRAHKHY